MGRRAYGVRKQARATKFAELIVRGYTQVAAWREVTPDWQEKHGNSQYVRASEFANAPETIRKIAELQKNAQITSLDNHVRYHSDLLQQIEDAKQDKNWNAVGQLMRTRGLSGAWLKESGHLTVEHSVAAGKLVEQLKSLGISPEAAEEFRPRTSFDETKH